MNDPGRLLEVLGVPEVARQSGGRELPSASAAEPGLEEREIRALYEAVREEVHQQAQQTHNEILAEETELFAQIEDGGIETCRSVVTQNFKAYEVERQADLSDANDREVAAGRRLRFMRHLVGGVLSLDQAAGHFLVVSVVLVLILVESLANGLVLGEINKGGYYGGIVQALAISVLSIGISWSSGDVLRHVFDISWIGRVFAIVGLVVWGAALTLYHCIVAWLRMVLEHADTLLVEQGAGVYELGSKPYEAFSWAIPFALKYGLNPAHLDDLQAWFLFIVGIFFAIGAFAAGWRHKDVKRRVEQARALEEHRAAESHVRQVNSAYIDGIVVLHGNGLAEVDRCAHNARAAMTRLRENVVQARLNEAEHKAMVAAVDKGLVVAIEYFRSVNASIRATPAPRYFLEVPAPLDDDGFCLDMANVVVAEELLGNALDAMRDIESRVSEARAAIRDDLQSRLAAAAQYLAGLRRPTVGDKVAPDDGLAGDPIPGLGDIQSLAQG